MPSQVDRVLPLLSIIISLLGLSIVLMMVFNPPLIHENFPWRKLLVGGVFNLVCILGIIAVALPKKCSRALYREERKSSTIARRRIKGHHPDCETFSTHVIKVGGYTLCAACTGLFMGGVAAIVVSALYFSGLLNVVEVGFQLILIGALGVIQIFFKPGLKPFLRLLVNAFFPVGASLVLIGVDTIFESMFIGMFLNALIIFWIITRIMISHWNHLKICSNCKSPCRAEA